MNLAMNLTEVSGNADKHIILRLFYIFACMMIVPYDSTLHVGDLTILPGDALTDPTTK